MTNKSSESNKKEQEADDKCNQWKTINAITLTITSNKKKLRKRKEKKKNSNAKRKRKIKAEKYQTKVQCILTKRKISLQDTMRKRTLACCIQYQMRKKKKINATLYQNVCYLVQQLL